MFDEQLSLSNMTRKAAYVTESVRLALVRCYTCMSEAISGTPSGTPQTELKRTVETARNTRGPRCSTFNRPGIAYSTSLMLLLTLLLLKQDALGQVVDTSPPTPPREVNARAISSHTVEVFWFPSMDNVGITYNIYRAPGLYASAATQTLIGTSVNHGMEQLGFQDTGLTPETDYTYWVSAVDPSGNESARVGGAHAAPTTRTAGTTNNTEVVYPSSVSPGASITVTQTITCNPACETGYHHDVHWGTSMGSLGNFAALPGAGIATTHVTTATWAAPSTPGNVYFMEDNHLGGTGYPLNSQGQPPHKEGMLFRIVVTNGNPLAIAPPSLPNGSPGIPYNQTLSAAGEGNGSYTLGVNEGRLPPGLTISNSGTISGTPIQGGTYSFIVMVEDSAGTTAFRSFTLTISGSGDTTPPAPPTGLVISRAP